MLELILAVGFAIIISAGCSLFEAALYSVPLRHLETMISNGKKAAIVFKDLRRDIERPITAILSLNTIANTAGAAVAGAAAVAVFGHGSLFYFSVFFTLAILLFSEVIPKTAGVVYSKSLVSFVAYPLEFMVKVMTPAVWLSGLVTRLISRNKPQESVSPEELRTMARLSLQTGEIKAYQEEVIDNILSLEQVMIKQVMTPRTVIFSLSEHLTLEQARSLTPGWEHSRFPVYDKDSEDIVGIVMTRDLFIALAEGKGDLRLTDLMMPVRFVVETARLNNVLLEFMGARQKLFVVIDEYGGLAGLVTMEDILEEILGREIIDESDLVVDKRKLARDRRISLISRQSGS